MEALVLTNCTSRKRKRSAGSRAASWPLRRNSKYESVGDLARLWKQAVEKIDSYQPAIDLYTGRSVVDASEAARLASASLAFVSAGLGLLQAEALVPHYDMTVSEGDSSIAPALARIDATTADWWLTLNAGPSIAEIIAAPSTNLVLIALPSGYLEMISLDLVQCADVFVKKLRIFTSSKGRPLVPEHLHQCVMPYDDRLEGTSFAGTRADFPQRALRHFVQELQGHRLSLARGRTAVELALSDQVAPKVPSRLKLSDDEIAALLLTAWSDYGGSSTRLLRYLRDVALVACEQGRFRRIWQQLRDDTLGTEKNDGPEA